MNNKVAGPTGRFMGSSILTIAILVCCWNCGGEPTTVGPAEDIRVESDLWEVASEGQSAAQTAEPDEETLLTIDLGLSQEELPQVVGNLFHRRVQEEYPLMHYAAAQENGTIYDLYETGDSVTDLADAILEEYNRNFGDSFRRFCRATTRISAPTTRARKAIPIGRCR